MTRTLGRIALCAITVLAAVAPTSVPAADKVKVAISQRGLWDGMITVIGSEKGFFKDAGIEVEYIFTQGGAETIQALISGGYDIAAPAGTLGILAAFAKDAPVRIISSEFIGASDIFWYVRADSPLKRVEDISGKRVAFSRPGSATHLAILSIVNGMKLTPKLVSTGGIPATRTQVMTGQVDVGWSAPPFNLEQVRSGETRILFRGNIAKELGDVSVRVNVANAKFLDSRRDAAKRYMTAYARSLDWMYDNQDAAAQRYADFNQIDVAIAKQALTFLPKSAYAPVPVRGLEKSMAQAVEFKFLVQPLVPERLKALVDVVHDPAKR